MVDKAVRKNQLTSGSKLKRAVELSSERKSKIRSFFLDSGAFSLYSKCALGIEDGRVERSVINWRNPFFKTKEFWKYVDSYAVFVKKYERFLDYYANVDAIYDPEVSWEVLKYLEGEWGLKPIPVIHCGTDLVWLEKHLEAGYDLIGLGGAGPMGASGYKSWADQAFSIICDAPDRLPKVRVHGFAITAYKILLRYPWWSVDSTSWAKWSGYGIIYVPHRRKGEFVFTVNPYPIFVSLESPRRKVFNRHVLTLANKGKEIVGDWLNEIKVPFGSSTEWGVSSENCARQVANLRFFERAIESLPDWPWPFTMRSMPNLGVV